MKIPRADRAAQEQPAGLRRSGRQTPPTRRRPPLGPQARPDRALSNGFPLGLRIPLALARGLPPTVREGGIPTVPPALPNGLPAALGRRLHPNCALLQRARPHGPNLASAKPEIHRSAFTGGTAASCPNAPQRVQGRLEAPPSHVELCPNERPPDGRAARPPGSRPPVRSRPSPAGPFLSLFPGPRRNPRNTGRPVPPGNKTADFRISASPDSADTRSRPAQPPLRLFLR
ncbi:MAG: hypothetical protein KatS3mg005_3594 [Bryobacteraceae bacterium]|nr:MAG: hypothetical protein KatS3mg005_3594 [Bryobacteraceae bacterium]